MDWITEWGPFVTSAPGWITMLVLGVRYVSKKWARVKAAERDGRLKAEAALLACEKREAILKEQVGYLEQQLYRRPTADEGGG